VSASTEAFGGTGLVLAVAFLSELAMLAALAFLGNAIGNGRAASVALAVALPLLAAVVWGVSWLRSPSSTSTRRSRSAARSYCLPVRRSAWSRSVMCG